MERPAGEYPDCLPVRDDCRARLPTVVRPALLLGYWLTNVLGFILLHVGAADIITGEENPYTKRHLAHDLMLSVGYTISSSCWFTSAGSRSPKDSSPEVPCTMDD